VSARRDCLVLGTAQLGLRYGVANSAGMLADSEAIGLVHTAIAGGIRTIDTARAYGDAERRIGLALQPGSPAITVVTKLDPFDRIPRDASPDLAVAAARESIALSCRALARERLDVLALHRAAHRRTWHGAVWRLLLEERRQGRIDRLGVSVQSPGEALEALEDPDVGHLQLPFNVLDNRWAESGVIDAIGKRADVIVHVRSVLLQGLLAGLTGDKWPVVAGVVPNEILGCLSRLVREFRRLSPADLCVAYVRAQPWIDGVVIGMETPAQLTENLSLFDAGPLALDEARVVETRLPRVPEALLDPARWPAVHAA
jgi:aryl-alcohol dehydrogenase-like predicted oxidoreductase